MLFRGRSGKNEGNEGYHIETKLNVFGRDINNPVLKWVGFTLVSLFSIAVFVVAIWAMVLISMIAVATLMTVMLWVMVAAALLSLATFVVVFPLDWFLKRLGRRGFITNYGDGGISMVVDLNGFRKADNKENI